MSNQDYPEESIINGLRGRVISAWAAVPMPSCQQAMVENNPGPYQDYFVGKKWDEVNFDDDEWRMIDTPLYAMVSDVGSHYYIQSYLSYSLYYDIHLINMDECHDSEIELIHYCLSLPLQQAIKLYSSDQIECIIDFLKLLKRYPRYFGYDELVAATTHQVVDLAITQFERHS